MNKQEIEQKLEEIIYNNSFYGQYGTEYYGDRIAKEAFNLALDIAAENAKIDGYLNFCKEDKQSILNLKL